jgi:outer membrane protein TolC
MPTVADAVATALESRADLKEQEERTASAKLKNTAAKLERLPSIIGYGDYGLLSGVQTHVVGATLKIPLFDGGRMESDRAQAFSLMRKEETEEEELRRRVELEIRKASSTLASTRQQASVAEQAVSFANDVLAHARRLYEAGLTNSIAVIDAQTQLEIANDEHVAALFDYTNARIDLAEAMGTTTKLTF